MPRHKKQAPQTLNEFLESYTVPNLRKLAELFTSIPPTRKGELVTGLQWQMGEDERLRELWESLDELQQAAVAEVVHSLGTRFDAAGFRAKYGRDPDMGTRRYSDFERATRLCLFIHNGEMPRDLKERLLAFVPPPRPAEIPAEDALPATITLSWKAFDHETRQSQTITEELPIVRCETEQTAQRDLRAVLRLIDVGKVSVSDKTKRATNASIKAITELLHGGDFYPPEETDDEVTPPGPIKAFALPLLIQSAGLANLSGTKLQLTPAGKQALTAPAHQTLRTVWQRWLKTTMLDEFNRVNAIKGQTGKGVRSMTAVAGRRAVIVEALKKCPPNQWIAFSEFSRFMLASGITFDVARDPWRLYIADPHYGSLGYSGFHDWNVLQERYMRAFLFEYAATMGLIDVAYIHPADAPVDYGNLWGVDDLDYLSRYDGLLYLRINALGAWCLGLAEKYVPFAPQASQVLEVLPTLEVMETEPLPASDALFLEQFAQKISDVVWKIQPTRLLKSLEEGHSVSEMKAFLQAKSGGSLPDEVAAFFKQIAERTSCLKDRGAARLIEVADPALAALIANDSRLRSLCLRAGERHIVVPAESESAFRRALRELGYGLPARRESCGWRNMGEYNDSTETDDCVTDVGEPLCDDRQQRCRRREAQAHHHSPNGEGL